MSKIFHINSNCAYVLVLSILSGTPSNAKYIKELLDNKKISISDANKILLYSHFVNPIFIVGTVGVIFLDNKLYGVFILISHYITNIIIGIFTRDKKKPKYIKINFNNLFNLKSESFIKVLKSSIVSSVSTLIVIFGTITSCLIISTLIKNIFEFNPILNGFLEITSGLKMTSNTNLDVLSKLIISTFFISFGGISIHAQVLSILDNKKIRYIPYLEARILHALISSLIVFLLYKLYINI